MRLARIYRREVHRVQVFDFGGFSDLIAKELSTRMLMEHRDAQGQEVFTSQAWRRLFDIKGPLVHELILEFFNTFRFEEVVLDLDTTGVLQFELGGARHRLSLRQFILALGLHTTEEMKTVRFGAYSSESARQILNKRDLRDYWIRISFAGDFFGTSPPYTSIKDPILRLCHRLIACSIAGRSQGLMVIDPALLVTDMTELVRLRIYAKFRDTWAWVPAGPSRQEGNARGVTEEASVAPGGGDEDEEMPQAVPLPPRTQNKRIARLDEEVHGMQEALQDQREVLDNMASDFSRFTT
nr:hypothetical protein [Tanacetum cinerariifolium]